MARNFSRPLKPPGAEQASFLMEAVIAAVLALSTLAAIAPLFAQQIELAKRARDTDLLEAAATKDVNAIRQVARYWRMQEGPYSKKKGSQGFLDSSLTSARYYEQRNSGAVSFDPDIDCTNKDEFIFAFLADFKNLTSVIDISKRPRQFNSPIDITPPKLASRYTLERTLSRLSNDPGIPTLVVSYKLTPLNNAPALAFERTAEVQLEMHQAC